MTQENTKQTEEKTEDGKKKGDCPPPAKVEQKRLEQSGKTFQQTGIEKKG